jgi:rRNA processing protein Krr1/Pno1
MTRLISISRDDLERDKAILFDARNLVEAIGRVFENETMSCTS